MSLALIALCVSLFLLAQSAALLIRNLIQLAHHWQLPTLWVGIICLGFATSAPELIVALIASLQHKATLAMGSVIGSNIANIGLVLGCSACIAPVRIPQTALRKELIILMACTACAALLLAMPHSHRWQGVALLIMLAMALVALSRKGSTQDPSPACTTTTHRDKPRTGRSITLTMLGLLGLLASAEGLVWSATSLAHILNISSLVIGLSVVAVGTSLPELAASLASTLHGEEAMVLGNVIGSNLFNLLAVLAIPLLIDPTPLPAVAMRRDLPCLLLFTAALYLVSRPFGGRSACVQRWEGGLLLLGYIGYIGWIAASTG